jgi:hypothetical protein
MNKTAKLLATSLCAAIVIAVPAFSYADTPAPVAPQTQNNQATHAANQAARAATRAANHAARAAKQAARKSANPAGKPAKSK